MLVRFQYLACALGIILGTSSSAFCSDTDLPLTPDQLKILNGMDAVRRKTALSFMTKMHQASSTNDGESLIQTLRPQHPRLMLLDSDFEQVRKTIDHDPFMQTLWESVQHRADKILAEPLAKKAVGETDQLELSRLVLKRVYTLAGTYRLSHDRRYLERARAEMLQAAALETWHPPHFLDVAEMTNAMALGYDWLFEDLSAEDRHTIKDAIVRLGLNEGIKAYQSYAWWTSAKNNWSPVCNGGLVAGALAIADEEPELANRILKCARVSLPLAMASFAPDGGWPEGPGYWSYCTRYVAYLCADLKSALGTDFNLTATDGLSHTGYFRIYCCGPIGKSFNFADATENVEKAWQMMWLSRVFNNPLFAGQEMLIGRDGPELFHLLYSAAGEPVKTAAVEGLPLNAMFKGVNVAFLRSSWTDPKAFYIGFKGGDNKANHSHLDLGTFVLDGAGFRWALDLGPDNYNLPGYFGKERFNYYRLRTEGHNCITVEKTNQAAQAKAPIIAFSDDAKFGFAIADLSDGYKDKLTSAQRGVALLNGHNFLIQDEITAPSSVPIVWHWHTKANVNLSGDGSCATLEQKSPSGNEQMQMRILSPAGAKFTIQTSDAPPPQMQQKDVTDLNIAIDVPAGQTTITVLVSQDPSATATVRPLKAWGTLLPSR